MRRVRARDRWGRDQIEVLGVLGGPARPVVGALKRNRAVDDHGFGVREPRPAVYPHRHSRRRQRLDPARASARRAPIGDHPDIDPAFLGPDQRADNAGPDRQPVSVNEDLTLGTLDRTLREPGAVVLGGEADLNGGVGTAKEIGRAGESTPTASGMAIANTPWLYNKVLHGSTHRENHAI